MGTPTKRIEIVEVSQKPGEAVWVNPKADEDFAEALEKAKREKEYAERAKTNWQIAPSKGVPKSSASRNTEPHYRMQHTQKPIDVDAMYPEPPKKS